MAKTPVPLDWLRFTLIAAVAAPAVALRNPERLISRRGWSLLCLILLPAIYLGLFGEFTVGRATLVPLSLIIVSVCLLPLSVCMAMQVRRCKQLPLLFPVAWYFLAACLSGWHSVSHLHWMRGVLELGLAFGFFYLPYFLLRNRRQLESSLNMLVLLAAATVLFAILQAVLFPYVRGVLAVLYRKEDLWWVVGWGWRGRLAGNWLHPSYLGSVLNVAAPFALLRYVGAHTASRRGLALIVYLTLAGGIALTGTRTPVLALVISSVIFVILARAGRLGCLALACAATLVIMLSSFHFRFAPPDVGSTARLPRSFAMAERLEFKRPQNLATVKMRWITQSEALSLFRTSPLFGIGMRNYPDRARGDPMAEFSVHNSLVQNLTELGLFGLAAFLVLMVAALRSDFRPRLSLFPDLRSVRAALFCSSAAILLESLAENSLSVWQVMALFWLIRGISVMIARRPADFVKDSRPAMDANRPPVHYLPQDHTGAREVVAG